MALLALALLAQAALAARGEPGAQSRVAAEVDKAVKGVMNAINTYEALPKSMTWRDALEHCENKRGMRLCLASEYCPGGKNPRAGTLVGSAWAPTSDANNEWLSVGNDMSRICRTHDQLFGHTPEWGRQDSRDSFKGHALCCPSVLSKLDSTGPTWQEAARYCLSRGKRLCSLAEYCPQGAGKAPRGGVLLSAAWAAVWDDHNEWVSVGMSFPRRLMCQSHSAIAKTKPQWGLANKPTPRRGVVLCCDDVFDNLEGRINHRAAEAYCRSRGKRLCRAAEYCPQGAGQPPRGGPRPGEAWAPVGDAPNEWISVGFVKREHLCKRHSQLLGRAPAWGAAEGTLGYIQCCAAPPAKPRAPAAPREEPDARAPPPQTRVPKDRPKPAAARPPRPRKQQVANDQAQLQREARRALARGVRPDGVPVEQEEKMKVAEQARKADEQRAKQLQQQRLRDARAEATAKANAKIEAAHKRAEQLVKGAVRASLDMNAPAVYSMLPRQAELYERGQQSPNHGKPGLGVILPGEGEGEGEGEGASK